MSAVHQKTSSSFRSKTYFVVAATWVRYPPVVCTMPFGFPVVPDVYRMNSMSSASIGSAGQEGDACSSSRCHQ